MRRIDFKVPIYDWEITIVTIYNKNDIEPLRHLLMSIEANKDAMEEDLHNVEIHAINGGSTWRDFSLRRGVIIIFPWSDKEHFYEVLNHEKRHLIDRILEWGNLRDPETAAYLDGYISKQIFTRIKELVQ